MRTLSFDRRIPLALVAGLMLQAAAALWWAAQQASAVGYIERRVAAVENAQGGSADVLVRLARIEERQQAQTQLLHELRARMGKP